jgi:hypothetical protein
MFILYSNGITDTRLSYFQPPQYFTVNKDVDFHHSLQFKPYREINYDALREIIQCYFSPSRQIESIINHTLKIYSINPDNTVAVYFRGTDKYKETSIPPHDVFLTKINELRQNDKVLVQTDSSHFLDALNANGQDFIRILENSVSHTINGIHNEKKPVDNHREMKTLLATLYILSRCKTIICNSSNVALFLCLFRGNNQGIHQILDGVWL